MYRSLCALRWWPGTGSYPAPAGCQAGLGPDAAVQKFGQGNGLPRPREHRPGRFVDTAAVPPEDDPVATGADLAVGAA